MKLLVLLFLVGCAIASPIYDIHDVLEDAADEVYHDFMTSLDDAGAQVFADENDIRGEVGQKLKDALSKVLEKIKDAVDQGKVVGEDLQNKLKELKEKLKEMKIDMGDKARELMDKLREKTRDFIKDLLDKLGVKGSKRSVQHSEIQQIEFNLKDLFRKLKKELLETIDKEKVKAMIEKLFGKGSDMTKALEDLINKKGSQYKQKLLDLIDRFLGKDDQFAEQHSFGDRRSVQDAEIQQIEFNLKDLFRKLKKELLETIDKEKVKAMIEKLFGKGSDMTKALEDLINKKGSQYKQKLLDLIDRFLGKDGQFAEQDSLGDSRRSVQYAEIQQIEFNLKDLFRKLKKELLETIDKEKVKAMIEKLFGKGSDMTKALEDLINNKGSQYKQKLLDLIDRFLGKDDQFAEQHSLGDYWQKIKDYFKDLKIDLQEKYMKFGEWIKKYAKETLDKGKGKMDNIKQIANEFLKHTKDVSKEVAVEALEFLKPYQEDLGSLYEQVKETVKDILKRKD